MKTQHIFRLRVLLKKSKYVSSLKYEDRYLGTYSTLARVQKVLKMICLKYDADLIYGFVISKETVDNDNYTKYTYQPELTINYDSKGKFISYVKGYDKSSKHERSVYTGAVSNQFTFKLGDIVMYKVDDEFVPCIVISLPVLKKDWKKENYCDITDDKCYVRVADQYGCESVLATELFPCTMKVDKKFIRRCRSKTLGICKDFYTRKIDWMLYNEKYKDIFDKLLT